MVAVVDPALGRGARHSQVAVSNTQDSLTAGQSGRLDDVHGIGHHIVAIGSIGRHEGGGRHNLLQIILGIHQQDHIADLPGLSVGIGGQDGQQIAHGSGLQVIDGHGLLLGISAAGNHHIVTHLTGHADGFLVAVTGNNTENNHYHAQE